MKLPYRAGVVPPRAGCFQDRALARELVTVLASGDTAVLTAEEQTHTSVLAGLGGVGKTQLAIDYAEHAWSSGAVELLVWITASSRDAILSGYARLAHDLTGFEDASTEEAVQRVLAWFAATKTRWLVVLDDVQSPGDVRALWPPVTTTGQVVATTRRRDAALRGYRRRVVEVGLFTPAESSSYLATMLADHPHLLEGAVDLAEELGHLPLALTQAAAYLTDRDLTCAAYRQRLTDQRHTLASLLPDAAELPDGHRATVAATWSLSIELADRLTPVGLARPLLDVASVLDANGIPADVFVTEAILTCLAAVAARPVAGEEARDALGCLHRLSLITLVTRSHERTVRVHALVQRATRDRLTDARLETVARAAADALLRLWPDIERDTAQAQVLRTNTAALCVAGGDHLWQAGTHGLLFRFGRSLAESGSLSAAVDFFQQLCTKAVERLGPDHPDTLTVRHQLAYWRARAGGLTGAVTAFEDLLSDRSRTLGPHHPDTLATRHFLHYLQGETGAPAEAATALAALLPDLVRVLGRYHPIVLLARHDQAYLRGAAGDARGAVTAIEPLLADRTRVMGPDHPDTLNTRGLLARWLAEAGDVAGAISEFEALLSDRIRVLGPEHPATMVTRGHLARWRGEAGNAAGAVAEFRALLNDRLRILGPCHPDTLNARGDLAFWCGRSGDPAGAAVATEELLADRVRILGSDHRVTLMTRAHLARWRGEAGDGDAAVRALEALLPDVVRVLGHEHPQTQAVRDDIHHWRNSKC
jgi:hypothetical protein